MSNIKQTSQAEQTRKTIEANFLAGLSPSQIAEAIKQPVESVLAEIQEIVNNWQRERVSSGEVDLRRFDVAINQIWSQVRNGNRESIDQLLKILGKREAVYQRALFDEPPAEILPTLPGQAEAKRGKAYFFNYLAETFPNIEDVYKLMAQGWTWNKAVYITWLATPKKRRVPKTAHELATEYLNLASARSFSTWRNDKNWPIDETAVQVSFERATAPGPDRLAEVVEALYDTAAKVGREGHADREMLLKMLGLLQQGAQVNVSAIAGARAQAGQIPEDIPDDELNTLIANLVIATAGQAINSQPADETANAE